ncbi:MAG: hypothetical protein LBU82_04060 [Treponema sp.]|nr:hypothetical protein [Treponema sp.]
MGFQSEGSASFLIRSGIDYREAADAGLLLWRDNFIFFLPFFALPFWVCAFALRLLPGKSWYLAWFALWLLKPLFDRPLLHVISIRFFESGAIVKRLRKGLGKTVITGLAGDLLWRRFSPLRSAMLPVRVLEAAAKSEKKTSSARTSAIAERREALKKGGLGYCFFLTAWGILLEAVLLAGEILFFITMAELMKKGFVSSYALSMQDAEIYLFTAWCFNYMLVETLYVCMGFSLYANSRAAVEGWDLEIAFRALAEKRKEKA